jgi:hypothetical protein
MLVQKESLLGFNEEEFKEHGLHFEQPTCSPPSV